MKNTRKFLAIVMVIAMIMSMGVLNAFAEEQSLGVVNNTSGHSYDAYQIFTGTQDTESDNIALGEVEWGDGINFDDFLEALQEDDRFVVVEANIFEDCDNAAEVAKVLTENNTKQIAEAFANVAAENLADDVDPVAIAAGDTSVTLATGYYLLVDTTVGDDDNDDDTAFAKNSALLQVTNNDVTINVKYDVPTVDKVILDNTDTDADIEETDANEASIGDTVDYKFTGTIPTNIADYESYYYVFTDTMSKGLEYNNDIEVTVNGVDVTEYFYIDATEYSATNGTTITIGMQDLLALELLVDDDDNAVVGEITDKTKVVVTYSATLNENAEVAGDGNTNEVVLDYYNDPNNNGTGTTTPPTPPTTPPEPETDVPTGKTPNDTVTTYTTELTILKYIGGSANKTALAGAEFTISGEGVNIVIVTGDAYVACTDEDCEETHYWLLNNNTYTDKDPNTKNDEEDYVYDRNLYNDLVTEYDLVETATVTNTASAVKCFVNENGTVTFTGLGAGTYTIEETVVPAGYNKADDIEFTVGFDYTTEKFTVSGNDVKLESDNTLYTEIANYAGSTLPETGGMGTALLIGAGSALALAAALFLVTKKRVKNAEF